MRAEDERSTSHNRVPNASADLYTSPMQNGKFIGMKKKFFSQNQHHQQSEFIFGTQLQDRGRYGLENEDLNADGTANNETVNN